MRAWRTAAKGGVIVAAAAAVGLLDVVPASPSPSCFTAQAPLSSAAASRTLCGAAGGRANRQDAAKTPAAASLAQMIDPRQWGAPPATFTERLSSREWLRMYRTLGISEDASRDQVLKATARLRKKYADDEDALQRVETANLWIMTRFVDRKEEATRRRQQANRLREFGDSPRRLFQKYVAGHLPPSVRQMFEAPTGAHFRRVSVLIGAFALMGLCLPASAMNFVGLAGASALGFVYTRARPEPVKDEFGAPGQVQKINPKEMGATLALVGVGILTSAALTFGFSAAAPDVSPALIFCETACVIFWITSLSFKVYGVFDE